MNDLPLGSLREAETQLEIAIRLAYCTPEVALKAQSLADEVGRLIRGLANSINRKH
jgi:four helix bundle protein